MKVYIITKTPFPNGMAASNRIKCYAKAIVEQGVECEILIYTRTEIYGKKPQNIIGKGSFEGIPYQYIGKTPLRTSNSIIRRWNDFKDKQILKSFLKSKLKQNDVVLGYVGTDALFINGLIDIIHKKGAKYVRELCEYPYGTSPIETKKLKRNRKISFEKEFPKCDGFIAISDTLVNLAETYKSKEGQIIKIPILVDLKKYDMKDLSEQSEYPYIFHSGTLYEQKDGILGMIEAFGIAKQRMDKNIHFVSTGTITKSPHSSEIKNLIAKYHLEDSIHFTGYLSEEELQDYLSKASLVIINKYNTRQNQYCFSTKLGEYLAAEKPVIITNVGEAMNWLTDNETAYIAEAEDINSLSNKIIDALSDHQKRKSIASRGKELCKNSFSYQSYGIRLIDFFRHLIK